MPTPLAADRPHLVDDIGDQAGIVVAGVDDHRSVVSTRRVELRPECSAVAARDMVIDPGSQVGRVVRPRHGLPGGRRALEQSPAREQDHDEEDAGRE